MSRPITDPIIGFEILHMVSDLVEELTDESLGFLCLGVAYKVRERNCTQIIHEITWVQDGILPMKELRDLDKHLTRDIKKDYPTKSVKHTLKAGSTYGRYTKYPRPFKCKLSEWKQKSELYKLSEAHEEYERERRNRV